MKVRYGIITLNQFEWVVDKHLPSVDFNLIDAVHLHVNNSHELEYHGSQQSLWDIMNTVADKHNMIISDSTKNEGVAPGWNRLCKTAFAEGCHAVIIANDDIILDPGSLARVVEALYTHPFVCFSDAGHNAFSFFGMQRMIYDVVGEFDEQFWPAYFEDNDYIMRMKLQGFSPLSLEGPSFFHAGSATIGKYNAEQKAIHHHNFRKNMEYYVQKWGGLPHHETYTTPFNR